MLWRLAATWLLLLRLAEAVARDSVSRAAALGGAAGVPAQEQGGELRLDRGAQSADAEQFPYMPSPYGPQPVWMPPWPQRPGWWPQQPAWPPDMKERPLNVQVPLRPGQSPAPPPRRPPRRRRRAASEEQTSAPGNVLKASGRAVAFLHDLVRQAAEKQRDGSVGLAHVLEAASKGLDFLDARERGIKEGYVNRHVLNSSHNETIAKLWAGYQEELTSAVQGSLPAQDRSLRILVVSPVPGTQHAVDGFAYNMEKLLDNRAKDTFHFALFHYDGNVLPWAQREWYTMEGSPIIYRDPRPLCKAQAWMAVTPDWVRRYNYVWLMDGDLLLDYFSWDLYRSVLLALDPLVSQPSVIGASPGARQSDIGTLNMVGTAEGMLSVAREVNRTESMTPVISARLWPAIYERITWNDQTTVWFLTDFWDMLATVANLRCGLSAPLVVNAAPVRHMNRHDLLDFGTVGSTHHCKRGCGWAGQNCRRFTDSERQMSLALFDSMSCPVSPAEPALQCNDRIRICWKRFAGLLRRRSWSVPHAGNISLLVQDALKMEAMAGIDQDEEDTGAWTGDSESDTDDGTRQDTVQREVEPQEEGQPLVSPSVDMSPWGVQAARRAGLANSSSGLVVVQEP